MNPASAFPADRQRIAAWGFARAVLSACWTAEESLPPAPHVLTVARALRRLL